MSETQDLIDHFRRLNPDFDRNAAEFNESTDDEIRQGVHPDALARAEEMYRAADDELLLAAALLNQKILAEGTAPRILLAVAQMHAGLMQQVMRERYLYPSDLEDVGEKRSREEIDEEFKEEAASLRIEVLSIPTEELEEGLRRSGVIAQHATPGSIRQHVNDIQGGIISDELRRRKG